MTKSIGARSARQSNLSYFPFTATPKGRTLNRFLRTYSFVSQISAFTDPALEADYVFCRALSAYLRVPALSSASTSETGEVKAFFGEGKGGQQELDLEHLSSIVDVLNDRFGTDLTEVDKLLLDQFEEDWVRDGALRPSQERQHRHERRALQEDPRRRGVPAAIEGHYLRKVYERLRDDPSASA